MAQHSAGQASAYTAKRLPVDLVYTQEFDSLREAFYAERNVKGWSRAKKEALIRGDYDALVELSKNRQSPPKQESPFNRHPELVEGREEQQTPVRHPEPVEGRAPTAEPR